MQTGPGCLEVPGVGGGGGCGGSAFPVLSLPTWPDGSSVWIMCGVGCVCVCVVAQDGQGELAFLIGSGLHEGKDSSIWPGVGQKEG